MVVAVGVIGSRQKKRHPAATAPPAIDLRLAFAIKANAMARPRHRLMVAF